MGFGEDGSATYGERALMPCGGLRPDLGARGGGDLSLGVKGNYILG
jgi:hypothetical protein